MTSGLHFVLNEDEIVDLKVSARLSPFHSFRQERKIFGGPSLPKAIGKRLNLFPAFTEMRRIGGEDSRWQGVHALENEEIVRTNSVNLIRIV